MGVSYRQGRRIYKRYREEGDRGLIHRNRGQPSNRRKPSELKGKVLTLYREQYWDFGPTLAAEKLEERDGYEVDHETLRRWLLAAGLWKRQRKRARHRQQREPTVEEQLAGELPLTQFGRACQKLGIEIITASSPQAKGRVERKH